MDRNTLIKEFIDISKALYLLFGLIYIHHKNLLWEILSVTNAALLSVAIIAMMYIDKKSNKKIKNRLLYYGDLVYIVMFVLLLLDAFC